MKLYWSSRSPYVRTAMIAIHELGLADKVQTEAVVVTAKVKVPELEQFNPLTQIPTLVLEDGSAIYDSGVIVDYLDAHYGTRQLLPPDYPRRLDVLKRAALAQGLTDKAMRWLIARFQPEEKQDKDLLVGLHYAVNVTLTQIEAETASFSGLPVDAGHIGLASVLGYLDFRFAAIEWRKDRPQLAAWHAEFAQRPSYINTEYEDSLTKSPSAVKT